MYSCLWDVSVKKVGMTVYRWKNKPSKSTESMTLTVRMKDWNNNIKWLRVSVDISKTCKPAMFVQEEFTPRPYYYKTNANEVDPFAYKPSNYMYTPYLTSKDKFKLRLMKDGNGYKSKQNASKTIIVTDSDGTVVGCGVIESIKNCRKE